MTGDYALLFDAVTVVACDVAKRIRGRPGLCIRRNADAADCAQCGNSATWTPSPPLPLDSWSALLKSGTRAPFDMSSTQQQQKPPALDWLSFPAPAIVDAPHPDLFDLELDNSLSAFDQAQVQLLTLDYNDSFAFTNYRSETPQGPPSVITASSESAYETLSSYSESLNNFSNNSPAFHRVEPGFPELNIDFARFQVAQDLNTQPLVMDPSREQALYGGVYDNRPHYDPTYALSDTRSNSYGAVPGVNNTVMPGNILNPGPRADNSESPKSSSDGLALHGSDGDPRKKYGCPNCTRCKSSRYHPRLSALTVAICQPLRARTISRRTWQRTTPTASSPTSALTALAAARLAASTISAATSSASTATRPAASTRSRRATAPRRVAQRSCRSAVSVSTPTTPSGAGATPAVAAGSVGSARARATMSSKCLPHTAFLPNIT